ncbi:acyltransferase family protein [Larkinella arboricola]
MLLLNSLQKTLDKPKEILCIQYLRGIAAILVILAHTTTMARFTKYFNFNILSGYFASAAVGVELFFVISGFIIAYVSLQDNLRPKIKPLVFLKRRFVRIIPFMWLCIIGYAILRILGRGTFPVEPYLRAMTLYPIGAVQPNQIWTLRHEFLFYGLFCVFILYKPQWKLGLLVWFLSPLLWFGLGISEGLEPSSMHILLDFIFNRVNLLFGLGFLIGIACLSGFLRPRISTQFGFPICFLLSIPILLVAHMTGIGIDKSGPSFVKTLSVGILSALVVIAAILMESKRPLNWMDRLGLLLGDASYAIYLTHLAVISAVLGVWSRWQPNANGIVILIVCCVLCCGIGIVVHKLVEKPLIKVLRPFVEKKKREDVVKEVA